MSKWFWLKIVLLIVLFCGFITYNLAEPAIMDDVAVSALNDPTASRAMVVKEGTEDIISVVLVFGFLGLSGWAIYDIVTYGDSKSE